MPKGRYGIKTGNPAKGFYKTFILLLLSVVWLYSRETTAQQTAVYQEPEALHMNAQELFDMKNYGAAKIIFETLGNQIQNKSVLSESARFHAASCAYYLHEDVALQRFHEFKEAFPASQWVDQSWFIYRKYPV